MGTSSRTSLYRGHAPGPDVDEVPQIYCQTYMYDIARRWHSHDVLRIKVLAT